MSKRVLTTTSRYAQLVRSLKAEIQRVKAEIEQRLVVAYWNAGRMIESFLHRNPGQTLTDLTRRLSQDLDIHMRTLQHCHQFSQSYPELDLSLPISWSHYRLLLLVDSTKERRRWERRIVKENLSQKEFLNLLNLNRAEADLEIVPRVKLPEPQRGLLYHYRLIKVNYLDQGSDGIMVDCGFENRVIPPRADGTLTNKRTVKSVNPDGVCRLKFFNATHESLYTYKAHIERVIDGDTLLANIDCGFGIWTRQRLRLRGIDAPERNTITGQRAKRRVEEELTSCAFVIIKTYKSDKYDRYLADIFFKKGETDAQRIADEGLCLNHLMINNNLARIWA